MKRICFCLTAWMLALCAWAQPRVCQNFDKDWEFTLGHAADPALDFGCGTEYFNYLTKAASIHNEGPYSPEFDKAAWPQEWKAATSPSALTASSAVPISG